MIDNFAYIVFEKAENMVPFIDPAFLPLLILLALWSSFWKGLALWHSARRKAPAWFIIMLLVNTVGILEIIYLFGVAKLKANQLFTSGK